MKHFRESPILTELEIEEIEHDESEALELCEMLQRDNAAHDSRDEFTNEQFVRYADRRFAR
jgi:hypothetical protein